MTRPTYLPTKTYCKMFFGDTNYCLINPIERFANDLIM